MIDYALENYLNLSDSWLEHWLLRYSQNCRGGGGGGGWIRDPSPKPIAIISHPAMQTQLSFLMLFVDDRLHLRELPQFLRFLIEALVIEVFTEPSWWRWWWWRWWLFPCGSVEYSKYYVAQKNISYFLEPTTQRGLPNARVKLWTDSFVGLPSFTHF